MRNVARVVPTWAAVFLAIMAVLINSEALFYMATAMFATIGACRLQAWLSVRGLRVERIMPPAVNVGELVTVSMIVWSERRMKRPLITVVDQLPERLKVEGRTPSFPIAPSYDQPIQTRYSFRPLRRGRFRCSQVRVDGTDALGLITASKVYRSEPTEITVYPMPIPLPLTFRPRAGIGASDVESGQFRGSGIEPRGVREYVPGDPQRYVHWASSARRQRLMVKEFEVGSGITTFFFVQHSMGSEIGAGAITTLEAMCGHAKYIASEFLKIGAAVEFPSFESGAKQDQSVILRKAEIDEVLVDIQADQRRSISEELLAAAQRLPHSGTIIVQIAVQDPALPETLTHLASYQRICLVYDCKDYDPKFTGSNAADPVYLESLRAAGAEVHMVPKVMDVSA